MKNRIKIVVVFVLGFLPFEVSAQFSQPPYDVNADRRTPYEYGRMVVDSLASPYYRGRGYTKEGDLYSALFVASELYKFNLRRFKEAPTFYQNFTMSVNTFPEEVYCALDERFLTCGIDFVPSANCPKIIGAYDLVWLDSTTVSSEKNYQEFSKRNFSNVFIVLDDKGVTNEDGKKLFQNMRKNPYGAKGLVILKDKILWTVATDTSGFASVEIVRGKIRRTDKKIRLQIRNHFEPGFKNRNVIAYIEGKEVPDSFIIVTAHYDHLGQIGRWIYFPGANDNASGIGMMLSLARHYAKKENQPKYSIAFIAFGAEEAGLIGSKKYVFTPVVPHEKTKFLINFDIMGTGDEGITVVNATEFKRELDLLKSLNEQRNAVPIVKERGPAANSDHYFFYEKGVRCFFVYTMGGIKAYHDLDDRRETLPLTKFEELHFLFVDFINRL